jgi:hypothetical protein
VVAMAGMILPAINLDYTEVCTEAIKKKQTTKTLCRSAVAIS